MILARVVGTVVATRKDPRLEGRTLLVLKPVSPEGPDQAGYVVAVDTVGAGDTFIGAFITCLVAGAEPRAAARFACAAAAIAVTRRGAQASIPTRAEVETLLSPSGEKSSGSEG